jgi:hypothetical protein
LRLNRKRSITLELTLLFAITSTVVLMTLGFVISSTVEKHFEEQDMEVLTAKMMLTRHTFEKFELPSDRPQIARVLNDALVGHQGLDLIVYDAKGETIFSTPNATFPKELVMSALPITRTNPSDGSLGSSRIEALPMRCRLVLIPESRSSWRHPWTSCITWHTCSRSCKPYGCLSQLLLPLAACSDGLL